MTRRARRSALVAVGAVLVGGLAAVAPVTVSSGAPPKPPAVAVAAPLTVLPAAAHTPAVSADGRSVVYAAAPTTDDGRTSTVFLLDRTTSTTTELTQPLDGLRAGNSVRPAISADGCHVVVVSEIPFDLFRDDDTGARWDVYQLTVPACGGTAGAWELISSRAEDTFGSAAGDDADPDETPAISGSGAVVAYTRRFAAAAAEGLLGVAVVDRSVVLGEQGRTRAVAGSPAQLPDTTFRYHGLHQPSLSDDGRFVAFTADADASVPVPVWATGDVVGDFATSQVYVWDRSSTDSSSEVRTVSSVVATPANGDGGHPSISHDGRYVAFESNATNLVAGAVLPTCTAPSVAAPPATTPATTAPTAAPTAAPTPAVAAPVAQPTGGAQRAADAPAADATDVAVTTSPTGTGQARLLAGVPDAVVLTDAAPAVVGNVCPPQIYRLDRDGSIELVSRLPAAPGATPVAADAGGRDPVISFDGSAVTFVTRATNLFDLQAAPTPDTLGGEVVTAAVDAGTITRVAVLADATTPAPLAQSAPRISADGRTVVFETSSPSAFDPVAADPSSPHVVIETHPPSVTMVDPDLGTVAVGSPSGTWYVGLFNHGPSAFVPGSITSSNPDFAVIPGGTCQIGAAVAVGDSCTVYLVLTPSTAGPKEGTLTVAEGTFGGATVSAVMRGGGGVGALGGVDAGHDFGSLRVGATSSAFTLRVANTGLGGVVLSGVTIDGEAPTDYTVTATTCAGVLDVGATCTVDVAFRPTVGGQRLATVRVTGETGEYTAMVVAGQATYSAASLVMASDRLVPGGRFGVGGSGFPANSTVTLSWADGLGGSYQVTTNRNGGFLASLTLVANERPGRRTLIARTAKGPSASADVVVLRRPSSPGLPPIPG